jgi:thiosulfate/3-mercaptopyruvate sulfurtransferase
MPIGTPYTALVSTDLLFDHLQDPDWIIFDCRFDLMNPGWGLHDYQKHHIPGAIYAHLNDELAGPIQTTTGRHPFPKPEHWVETLSNWGVNPGKQVVIYDSSGGSNAARMWWMLRWIGLTRAAVLDGGLDAWLRDSRPQAAGIEIGKPTWFFGRPNPKLLVKTNEVDRIRLDPQHILIDARSPVRFRGEQETIDAAAGHIPGAINHFYGDNLTPDGKFLSPEILREKYLSLLHGLPPQNAVIYCGSGVTSCHVLLALEAAGLPGARLYPGSWSEWIRDPQRPIAVA